MSPQARNKLIVLGEAVWLAALTNIACEHALAPRVAWWQDSLVRVSLCGALGFALGYVGAWTLPDE